MTDDFFLIDVPVFEPKYEKDQKYGFTKYKNELWELLSNTTGGYCMYCFDIIKINGQRRGQIEHGIEKTNSLKRLKNCVPNLGIACEVCNDSYKRKGEKRRKLSAINIAAFEKGDCKEYDCKEICSRYKKLRQEYMYNGKLLLQPFGFINEKTGHTLRIQYDLLNCKYIPSRSHTYDENEIAIIEGHINQFGLNSSERKNYELGRYCKDVINNNSIRLYEKYNNKMVDLLKDKLRVMKKRDAIKICNFIYYNSFYKRST